MKQRLEVRILGVGLGILVVGIALTTLMVLKKQRSDVYDLARERLYAVSELMERHIEGAMLSGKAKLLRGLLPQLAQVRGVEDIKVLNWQGREAFKKDAPFQEFQPLKRLTATAKPFDVLQDSRLTLYRPLFNKSTCKGCHQVEGPVLGAVKVVASLRKEQEKIAAFTLMTGLGSLLGAGLLGMVFWLVLRRMVINPVQELEEAARAMARGDLNFRAELRSQDEIGRLQASMKESLRSLSSILRRVKEVSRRIADAADSVQKDSDRVVSSTQLEAEAVADISSSVEELNAAIGEIAESVDGLAASVEQTAASVEEMASSIESISTVVNDLSGGVEATSSSIHELSATLKEVAGGARELAEVSDETLTAVEEIISSIKEVEERAKDSARLSERVTEEASTMGVAAIEKTKEGMQRIKTSVEETAHAIKKLGDRSEEIGKILTVIDEITDQTTLLALNAAILAAQAGEHGKGFSVVADEIKSLAERTGFSTQEIASLIEGVQAEVKAAAQAMRAGLKAVEEGMDLTKEADVSIKKILQSAQDSTQVARSIERTTAEQARSARLVSASVERMRTMVQQMAKATSEQSRGISLIMEATERMRDASSQVKLNTEQQAHSSRQIAQAVEVVSDKSQQILKAINEQKVGSGQIWSSIEKIKDIPKESRDIAFRINRTVKELLRDAELVNAEMERFRLYEEAKMEVVRFGVVPLEAPAEMYRRFSPLMQYLQEALGMNFELRVASSFEAAVKELGEGITNLCYMTPSTYILAHRSYGAEVLVKALRDGKPFHHSVIISRRDGPVKELKDIKGRSFAFGDVNSTSSHIVPRAMLLEEGIELKDLSYYNYLGHHDDVAQAVLKGEFDAGGLMESTAHKYREQGLRFVKFSLEIPEFNICVHGLEPGMAQAIKEALLALRPDDARGSRVLASIEPSYTGFAEAEDEDYNQIRLMMSKIGML